MKTILIAVSAIALSTLSSAAAFAATTSASNAHTAPSGRSVCASQQKQRTKAQQKLDEYSTNPIYIKFLETSYDRNARRAAANTVSFWKGQVTQCRVDALWNDLHLAYLIK